MHKRIKPFVAGAIGIAQAEAVAAVLVEVELYGAACFVPGFDHAVINCVRIKDTIRCVTDPHPVPTSDPEHGPWDREQRAKDPAGVLN